MDLESNENISDQEFWQLSVGDNNFNINRKPENFTVLVDFSDAVPEYNPENGIHLRIRAKKTSSGTSTIIPLDNRITTEMIIPNSKEMTDEQYFNTFVEKKKSFVQDNLVRQTFAKGYEQPAPVQALTIIEMIRGNDILAQSKSGSGKTHAFLFGTGWKFDPTDEWLQLVYITSSHEVAEQIYDQIRGLLPAQSKIYLCVGHKKDSQSAGGF